MNLKPWREYWTDTIAGILTAAILVAIANVVFIMTSEWKVQEIAPLISTGGLLVGLWVAIRNHKANIDRQRSEDYYTRSVALMEQAYDLFTKEMDDQKRPRSDRLLWLTVARMVRHAEALGEKITDESHRDSYKTEQFYWRLRFHDILASDGKDFPPEYYAETLSRWFVSVDGQRLGISENSLAVLYRFIRWPKDEPDPISNEANFSDAEIQNMLFFNPKGLGRALTAVRDVEAGRKNHEAGYGD